MKKVVMLSAAALLAMSGIAVSQAAEEATTEVQATSADAATTEVVEGEEAEGEDAQGSEALAEEEADAEEPIPEDTPQVQKLIALYPKLISRIEPVGKVCYEGEECDVTVRSSGGAADGEPRDGKAVYNAVCHTCHATGLLGSPALGDAGAWGPRISKGKDTLYDHAINGFNAMPAKGGADIPDEEVQNAVDYMVAQAS